MTSAQEVLNQKRNQYEPAFHLLVQYFLRVCEFIEPADTHLQVYSHRLYELLLRACTEFESLSREILEAHELNRAGNPNITDYVAIAPILDLQRQRAIVSFWRPAPVTLAPFEHWTPAAVSLPWYQGYNAVKHNRNAEFSRGTLGNVCDAICGVFIIMARLGFLEVIGSRMNAPGGALQGIDRFRDIPFALHYEFQPAACREARIAKWEVRRSFIRSRRPVDSVKCGARRMNAPMSVTFDSNVWESIVDTEKLPMHANAKALGEIRWAIEDRRVAPYLSDAVVLLESVRKADRAIGLSSSKICDMRRETATHFAWVAAG